MMSFNGFCHDIVEEIRGYLPQEYKDAQFSISMLKKLGTTYPALRIYFKDMIFPVFNMEEFYRRFRRGEEKDVLLHEMAEIIKRDGGRNFPLERIGSLQDAEKWLFVRVSNAEKNREYLHNIPHINILNLALTCHVLFYQGDEGTANTIVTKELMAHFGVSCEELFEKALQNSMILYPAVMDKLYSEDSGMWMLSNTDLTYGAAALFYPGMQERISEELKGSYYVLPSSVHECILIPDYMNIEVSKMTDSVREINRERAVIPASDVLSDSVYHYDHRSHSLTEIDC